jgi:hypothetical protein
MTAVTITVNKLIEGKQKILDLTSAEKLLKNASVISLGNCGCRTKLKKCAPHWTFAYALTKKQKTSSNKKTQRKFQLNKR